MFLEWVKHWRTGKTRKRLDVRFSWPYEGPVRVFLRWLRGRRGIDWWNSPVWFWCHTRTGDQHECYCREGSRTLFGFELFGIRLSVELSRAWVKRPCHCDKIIWLYCPDNHADEIEEYGAERLKAEYPGVGEL